MAFSTLAYDSGESEAFAADCPLFVGHNVLRDATTLKWTSTGTIAGTDVTNPLSYAYRAYDGRATVATSAYGTLTNTIYFVAQIPASTIDTSCLIFSPAFASATVTVQIADDAAFTTNVTTFGGPDATATGNPRIVRSFSGTRHQNVEYVRVRFVKDSGVWTTSNAPRLVEWFLGRGRIMSLSWAYGSDYDPDRSSVSTFDSRSGEQIRYVHHYSRFIVDHRQAISTTGLDAHDDVTTIRTLSEESLSFTRPILYIQRPTSELTYARLGMANVDGLDMPQEDYDSYDFRFTFAEQPIYRGRESAPAVMPSYAWAPFDITGSELYLSAAPLRHMWVAIDGAGSVATTRVAAAGDLVGRVDSPASGTHVALAAANGERPVYRTASMPHFEFDGVDDKLVVHNSIPGFAFLNSTAIGSILMKVGVRTNGAVETILDNGNGPAASAGVNVTRTAANTVRVTLRSASTIYDFTTTATLLAADGIVPVEIRFNNASGGDIRINGGTLETFTRTNAPTNANPATNLCLGARNTGTDPGPIDLADILITNTYVSDADCTLYRNYSIAGAPSTYLRQTGLGLAGGAPWFNMVYRWYDFTDTTQLWQNSARTTPVAATNDPIEVADHKSDGSTQHLNRTIIGTGTERPLYQGSGGGADFDGSNDRMTVALGDNMYGGARTIVFICRNDDAVNGSRIMNANGSWNVDPTSANINPGAATATVSLGNNTGFNAIAFVRDGSNWTSRARGNGVQNTGSGSSSGAARIHTFGEGGGASTYHDGRLVEVLVFHEALSSAQLDIVYDGLVDKHSGLSL